MDERVTTKYNPILKSAGGIFNRQTVRHVYAGG